eukprot:1324314-Amorphochlora_amoeboformis.AAC.2
MVKLCVPDVVVKIDCREGERVRGRVPASIGWNRWCVWNLADTRGVRAGEVSCLVERVETAPFEK